MVSQRSLAGNRRILIAAISTCRGVFNYPASAATIDWISFLFYFRSEFHCPYSSLANRFYERSRLLDPSCKIKMFLMSTVFPALLGSFMTFITEATCHCNTAALNTTSFNYVNNVENQTVFFRN